MELYVVNFLILTLNFRKKLGALQIYTEVGAAYYYKIYLKDLQEQAMASVYRKIACAIRETDC